MLRLVAWVLICLVVLCSNIVMEIKMAGEKSSILQADENVTFLQQHASYFDINKDDIIYPWETFVGLRNLGYNVIISTILSIALNGIFSYPTLPTWIPSLLFPLYIVNIHKNKHGSDTVSYNYDGRFHQSSFDELVKRYANTQPNKFTLGTLEIDGGSQSCTRSIWMVRS